MLLDVGPRADGTLPDEVVTRLKSIGAWLRTNGEAIYETRPWEHTFGEGPTVVKEGMYVADHNRDFTAADLRFTVKGQWLFLHTMGAPGPTVRVQTLRPDTPLPFGTLKRVRLLGAAADVPWQWSPDGLVLHVPDTRPSDDALVFELS